ncbi:MAG: hypothetical protein JXQ93_07235 [Flavobacteriaceae bacterium]
MKKTILRLLLLSPILMAFQCFDDEYDIIQNEYNVTLTNQSNFAVNDIIWVEGKVSSKGFDTEVNDSIFLESPVIEDLNIMRLVQQNSITSQANSRGAINDFVIVNDIGSNSSGLCDLAAVIVTSELSADEKFYTYRIGFKATTQGDYFISFRKSDITNSTRNESIFNPYRLTNNENVLGFDLCGNTSARLTNESDREFFFTVN